MAPSRYSALEPDGLQEDDVDEVRIDKLNISDTADEAVPHAQPDDSSLIRELRTLAKKQPKLVRGKKYAVPGQSIELTSWKMTEWMYTKSPCPFPTLARGLFTRWIPARGHENDPEGTPRAGKDQIVVRGYDKFFNMNEVKWNTWEALEIHTTSPYTLTLKSNGCIIFMAALTPTELIVTSKHSLGEVEGASVSHAQKGEEWLEKHLKKAGKTKAEFSRTLFDRNLTAVAELCDDSFEEHVLPYSKEMTGLHLHGLNERRVEFSTLEDDQVVAFAQEWGFITTPSITFNTIEEVKKFTDNVSKEGKWRGEAVEGFVVRTKVSNRPSALVPAYRGTRGERIANTTEQSTPPPYGPGSTFFFKIKFEEPYLMYREWREVTKKMLAANNKGQLRGFKPSSYILRRPETRAYYHWIEEQIIHDPDSLKGFNEGHGIIAARERFLRWCETPEGKAILRKEDAKPSETIEVNKGSHKTIVMPVAIPGSGKTAVALALKHIYGFGHTQSDDIKQKKTGPQFVKNVVELFKTHDIVFADRNNHIRHLRDSLKEEFKEKYADKGHIIALQWVFNDTIKNISDVCADRIVARGGNHQTLHADNQDTHRGVIRQFFNSFEEVEAEEVDDIVDMEYTDTLEQSVKRAISGLAPILDLKIPDDRQIDEACDAARSYTVKSTVTKKAAPKPPRYFALVPNIDAKGLMGSKFEEEQTSDLGKRMWSNLVDGERILGNPHITLVHVKEKQDSEEFWKHCLALQKSAGEIEPMFRVTFDHVVWNDNVTALSVSKVEIHREFDEEHRQLAEAVLEKIPENITNRLHLTIGTRNDSINAFEAASMVAGWRNDSSLTGLTSLAHVMHESRHRNAIGLSQADGCKLQRGGPSDIHINDRLSHLILSPATSSHFETSIVTRNQTRARRAGKGESQLGDADASKTGLQSLEQSIMGPMVVDLNPRPDPDAMDVDVDSKRGEPAREKPIVKSRKRPRIGNRVLREQPPMATISLPPELLVEIFKYLRPADLFSLDQLEAFRSLLMGESSQSTWKAVIKNVRGLPDCPTGFSERQYLAVLFSKFCTFCGSAENCTMDTTLLVRLCDVCADECLALLIDVDKVPEKVRDFLHRSNVFGEGYGGQLPDARVLRSNVQQIVNALDENDWPGNDNALIRLKQQWEGEVLERKELSKKIIRALELLENDLACERREIRIQRRREIARRCIDDLKIQEWDLQLQLSWSSPSQKEFYKLVNKPGLLYDREWGQVSSKLKRLIKAQLADKGQEERRRTKSGYLGEVIFRLPEQPLFLEIDSVMDGIYDVGESNF